MSPEPGQTRRDGKGGSAGCGALPDNCRAKRQTVQSPAPRIENTWEHTGRKAVSKEKESADKTGSAPAKPISFPQQACAFKHAAHHRLNIHHFTGCRPGTRNKNHIPPGLNQRFQLTIRFPDNASGTIACNRFSNFFAGCDSDTVLAGSIPLII